MARHLVISFEDNGEAEEFMAALKIEGAVFFQDKEQHFKNINPKQVGVTGVFAKPTRFCQCEGTGEEIKTVRSKNYGWYVHVTCNKPISGHIQSAMKNLLDPPGVDSRKRSCTLILREGEMRYPEPTSTKPKEVK